MPWMSLFCIGFISILGQVVLFRELLVAFSGVELMYILSIGIWLFWSGMGSLIGKQKTHVTIARFRFFLIAAGILPLVTTVFIRSIRIMGNAVPGAYLSFSFQIFALILTFFPIGILLGVLFQSAAKLHIDRQGTMAGAYAVESAGGIAGGIVSMLFLHLGIQNAAIAIFCGIPACIISSMKYDKANRQIGFPGSIAFFVILFLFPFSSEIDHFMTRWNHPNLLDTRDSPYGRVTIVEQSGQIALFQNGVFLYETDDIGSEELVHPATLQNENPETVLVLGGGFQGILSEVLKYHPKRVDCVELDDTVIDFAEKYFPETLKKSFSDPSVHLIIGDPGVVPRGTPSYDLILLGATEPVSTLENRFFTIEFFRKCANRMKPRAVLGFRLRTSENIRTNIIDQRNDVVFAALKGAFHDVIALQGTGYYVLLASKSPLSKDPTNMANLFSDLKISTRFVSPPYIRYLYENDRTREAMNKLQHLDASPNSENRPACYWFGAVHWISRFFPNVINLNIPDFQEKTFKFAWLFPAILFSLPFFWVRLKKRKKTAIRLHMGMIAFMGMIMETIWILSYQIRYGILFQDVGLLMTAFMAGLATAPPILSRWTDVDEKKDVSIPGRFEQIIYAGNGILAGIWGGVLFPFGISGFFLIFISLFFQGMIVSGIFLVAGAACQNKKLGISVIYASDLFGGCIGSILACILFIPIFGMKATSLFIAVLSAWLFFFPLNRSKKELYNFCDSL